MNQVVNENEDNKLTKVQVLEHRSRTHQIFLTVFALILGLNNNEISTDLMELLLVLALCYVVTLFQNLLYELKFVSEVKFPILFTKKITLIIPISITISLLRVACFELSGPWYFFSIIFLYCGCILLMYYLSIEESTKNCCKTEVKE